ncbi:MAG: TonB C-terminal domain-containing protein [Candidatus Hydrogenedentes bacterium]|nr:TonB C-terminal domain-containing protein [Candidatus Hydrogenedentota bacterium]
MSDRARVQFAAACSVAFHLLVLVLLAYGPKGGQSAVASLDEPLILQLRPPEALPKQSEEIERLVAPGTPATGPVPDTDQISTLDSQASDMSNSGRDEHAPAVDKVSDFIAPGGGNVEAAPPPPQAPSAAQESEAATTPPEAKEHPKTRSLAEPEKDTAPRVLAEEPKEGKTSDKAADAKDDQPLRKFDMAKAETPAQAPIPPSQAPAPDPGPSSGLVQGGVKNPGFLGFEAKKSEYAPYLQEIKRRVEKRWRTTLQLRYSGTAATQAVVDCAISPDGRLVSVQIVDPGNSVSYAPLCRESIEKAGPFPAFPFTVPEAYRSKNLEIRWTFSFM